MNANTQAAAATTAAAAATAATAIATAATATAAATLTKVAADYKLAAGESMLIQGRKNPQGKPYHHVILRMLGSLPTLPVTSTLADEEGREVSKAVSKLWELATADYLKARAGELDAGASLTIHLSLSDLLVFVNNIGNRAREALSKDEIAAFCASYAFRAVAEVHSWTTLQLERVSTALQQYAAPAFRRPPQDADVLATRLSVLPTLLTGDDGALDADINRAYQWLMIRLERDKASSSTNLADAI